MFWTGGHRSAYNLFDLPGRGSAWEQMGSSCCRANSPCDSAEERSGLLNDDAKATVTTGKTAAVGTCGPEGDDELR